LPFCPKPDTILTNVASVLLQEADTQADAARRVRLDPHTTARARERGTNETEILDVIRTGTSIPARGNRCARAKVYSFNSEWNGKFYPQKQVEVVYVTDNDEVTTVTMYVFFGRRE